MYHQTNLSTSLVYDTLHIFFCYFFSSLGDFSTVMSIQGAQFMEDESHLPLQEVGDMISPSKNKEDNGKNVMESRDPVRRYLYVKLAI